MDYHGYDDDEYYYGDYGGPPRMRPLPLRLRPRLGRPPPKRNSVWGMDLFGAADGHGDDCCPHVVDAGAFTAVLGGIALVTFFLNMQITASGQSVPK